METYASLTGKTLIIREYKTGPRCSWRMRSLPGRVFVVQFVVQTRGSVLDWVINMNIARLFPWSLCVRQPATYFILFKRIFFPIVLLSV